MSLAYKVKGYRGRQSHQFFVEVRVAWVNIRDTGRQYIQRYRYILVHDLQLDNPYCIHKHRRKLRHNVVSRKLYRQGNRAKWYILVYRRVAVLYSFLDNCKLGHH